MEAVTLGLPVVGFDGAGTGPGERSVIRPPGPDGNRSEGDQRPAEGDRQADQLGPAEVPVEPVSCRDADRIGATVADFQLRMPVRQSIGDVQDRPDRGTDLCAIFFGGVENDRDHECFTVHGAYRGACLGNPFHLGTGRVQLLRNGLERRPRQSSGVR
jgi:hypothetical protein